MTRRRSRSKGEHNEGPLTKKFCAPFVNNESNQWEKLFYNLAVEFNALEVKPLDHFMLLPSKAFLNRKSPILAVINSKRYIPKMLEDLGITLNDKVMLPNNDSLCEIYDVIMPQAGMKSKTSLIERLRLRFQINERQIGKHSDCFFLNFNPEHKGHGWKQSIIPPNEEERWPPDWFRDAAKFLVPSPSYDAIMASSSNEASTDEKTSNNLDEITRAASNESIISNSNSIHAFYSPAVHNLTHNFDHEQDGNAFNESNSDDSNSRRAYSSETNKTTSNTSCQTVDRSLVISAVSSTASSTRCWGNVSSGTSTMIDSSAENTFSVVSDSYIPQDLQRHLVAYNPTKARQSIQMCKGGILKWKTGGGAAAAKNRHENTRRSNKKEILSFLHMISNGDPYRATSILEEVVKAIPIAKEKLLRNVLDEEIVSSISTTIKSLGGRGRTKETQDCINAIAFSAIVNLEEHGVSKEKVRKRLNLTTNMIMQASGKAKVYHDQIRNGEKLTLQHRERKIHNNSHSMNGAKECVHEYCHSDYNAIRVESNNAKPILVDGRRHPKRIWDGVSTQDEKYNDFCKSDDYLIWKSRKPKRMIGKRSFLAMICKCVKDAGPEDCVNQISYDLKLSMKGLWKATHEKAGKCKCAYHESFRNETSFLIESDRLPLEKLLLKSHFHLVRYTCCKRMIYDDLQCGIGSTATNPFLIPFDCVYSATHTNCGVHKCIGQGLELCPVFKDTSHLCRIQYFEEKAETGGITQPEVRDMYIPTNEAVEHFLKCLVTYRRHDIDDQWTRHTRKLDQTMGDPVRNSVLATDFMATANLQSIYKANSAIDAHAMNAIFLGYCDWRKVLYSIQKEGFSMHEPRQFEDWVMVNIEEPRRPKPKDREDLSKGFDYGVLPFSLGVFRKRKMKSCREVQKMYDSLRAMVFEEQKEWQLQILDISEREDEESYNELPPMISHKALQKEVHRAQNLAIDEEYYRWPERMLELLEGNLGSYLLARASNDELKRLYPDEDPRYFKANHAHFGRGYFNLKHEYFEKLGLNQTGYLDFDYSLRTWIDTEFLIETPGQWVIVEHEYDTKYEDTTIENTERETTTDPDEYAIREDWVWVDGDECIVNETHCFHYIGESETKNKDNNHQYDLACTNDLIHHREQEELHRLRMSEEAHWIDQMMINYVKERSFESVTVYAIISEEMAGQRNVKVERLETKYSDNCAAQYKNRFQAMSAAIAHKIHPGYKRRMRFAIKFTFKGNWDGEGKVVKVEWRNSEIRGEERIHNAPKAFLYAKKKLTKKDYHKAWKNVSVCDSRYIVSIPQATNQKLIGSVTVPDGNRGDCIVFVTTNDIFPLLLRAVTNRNVQDRDSLVDSINAVYLEIHESFVYREEGYFVDTATQVDDKEIAGSLLVPGEEEGAYNLSVTVNEIFDCLLGMLRKHKIYTIQDASIIGFLYAEIRLKYGAQYKNFMTARIKFRAEGSGGIFSSDMICRAPKGIVMCSDDSILDKRISSLDTRTIKYATGKKDIFFELSALPENKTSIIYVDRRTRVLADPGTAQIPGGMQEVFEMEGGVVFDANNNENLGSDKLCVRGLYCSCKICRAGNQSQCQHLRNMGEKKGRRTETELRNRGTLEYYRCLCCCKIIPLYEQALRHSTRRECEALNAVSVVASDSRFLRMMVETCIAKCPETIIQGDFQVLTQSYDVLHYCCWKLPLLVVGGNNGIQNFGLRVQHDDTYRLSYIHSMDQSSPIFDQISEEYRENSWILSIDGDEMRGVDDILCKLNGGNNRIDPDSLKVEIERISRESNSKKKEYEALARKYNFTVSSNQTVAKFKERLIGCVDEYTQNQQTQQQYREIKVVVSKRLI